MIGKLVSKWAEITPDAPVFLDEGKRALTYQELAAIIDKFRTDLHRYGFARQDRIAVVHSGGTDMAATVVGICASITVVPLNPELSAGEFALHLQDKKVTGIAIEAGLETAARIVADRLGLPQIEIVPEDRTIAGSVALIGQVRPPSVDTLEPAEENDVIFVLTTSGTTSYGKIVPLRQNQTIMRIQQVAQYLQLTPEDRCINLMPLFHIGGLSAGVLSSIYAGSSIMPIKKSDLNVMFRCLEEISPTFIAGSYTSFHAIERKAPDFADVINRTRSRIRMLRTGTGHLDRKIADSLTRIFDAPVIEAYGSSETGFMSCTLLPPATNKPGSVGKPLYTDVSIVDPDGHPVAPGQEGEVAISGPSVFSGYENNEAANRTAFKNGRYYTGDLGKIDEDGFLFITGRLKEMINRGGIKISPSEIDQALMRHEKIVEAVTIPVSHPTLGEDIAAAVVLKPGETPPTSELTRFLGQHLAPHKIPRRIVYANEIPKGRTGKIQRRDLAEKLGLDEKFGPRLTAVEGEQDATELERALREIWQHAMGLPAIGLNENFFELGGDSLQAVDLFLMIEKKLEQRLPRDILFEAGTIAEMARLIERQETGNCIVPIKPKGSRPPFFCIHPIGGEVLGYRDLAGYLEDDQPVYGVQSFIQGSKSLMFESVEEMAAYYLAEIRKVQPKGPYFLGGHSFGGLVAYAIAQRLNQEGDRADLLAMFDTFNISVSRYVSATEWIRRHWHVLKRLPASERPGYITQRLRNLRGQVPQTLNLLKAKFRRRPDLDGLKLSEAGRAIRENNMLISRKYSPPPYHGDAVLFATKLPTSWHGDVHDSWKTLVKGRLDVRYVPGSHLEIMMEPYVKDLARELSYYLQEKQENSTLNSSLAAGGE